MRTCLSLHVSPGRTMQKTSLRILPFACALAFAALVPSRADAQFGGLMKKAKEAVAQKGAEQAGEKMTPVAPGEQITDDLLGQVLRGAQAADRVLDTRDKLTTSRDAKNKDLSALLEKNQPVHRAYDEANNKISDCRSTSLSNLREEHQKAYDAKVKSFESDPNMMGKMQLIGMKYAKAMGEAQQKQDAAALQKVQMDMVKEITGADPFADAKK